MGKTNERLLLVPLQGLWVDLDRYLMSGLLLGKDGLRPLDGQFDRDWYMLDLRRPGASDLLSRRVATVYTWDYTWDPKVWRGYIDGHNHPSRNNKATFWWTIEDEDDANYFDHRSIAALAALDPMDDTRLDWGPLGSPRVVDLAALGIVAQHLTALERNRGGK